MNEAARGISILGATGSIGTQCLDIVRRHPSRLRVVALTANRSTEALARQALEFRPQVVAIQDQDHIRALNKLLAGTQIKVLAGSDGVCACAQWDQAEIVVGAVSGVAGLRPVLAALEAGKVLALANKETLVAAGHLANEAARIHKAVILPVDSEHAAIFQCLERGTEGVEKIVLTASGGPFRTRDVATFESITPEEALKHPNWSMGAKVTIDSATMMNKGLEVIEARWLFGLDHDQIDVVVHPESIVHSMVVYRDGSTKAQLSLPDMRLPIQYALSYPERWPLSEGRVDWSIPQQLEFLPPDLERFPCLGLAYEALRIGGSAPVVLNAANEAAVALFLEHRLSFTGIPRVVERGLSALAGPEELSFEGILEADYAARRFVESIA